MRPRPFALRALSATIATLLCLIALQGAQAGILAQWVQLGADGSASVRAISDDTCPSVTFDSTAVAMTVRSAPGQNFANVKAAKFPVRGCEAALPAGTSAATLDGKPLPLPTPTS